MTPEEACAWVDSWEEFIPVQSHASTTEILADAREVARTLRQAVEDMEADAANDAGLIQAMRNEVAKLRQALAEAQAREETYSVQIVQQATELGELDAALEEAQEAIQTQNGVVLAGTKRVIAAEAERDEAIRKLAEAIGALSPFANAAEDLDDETQDHSEIWELPAAMSIKAGDLRDAKRALSEPKRPE